MKPILYSDTETAFVTNGLGIMSDAISTKVVQELNGQYELTLKYPITGIHSKYITDRCIIVASSLQSLTLWQTRSHSEYTA